MNNLIYIVLITILLQVTRCTERLGERVSDFSGIYQDWFISNANLAHSIPPKVIKWSKCGEAYLIVQIPDSTQMGNVGYLTFRLDEEYPDLMDVNKMDSIQLGYVKTDLALLRSYEMDTAYWVYKESPYSREGPFTLKEVKEKIICSKY